MKKLLLLSIILIILLSGCSVWNLQDFNNKNIIEYKKCKEAGMEVALNGLGEVICDIK